jgi:hypothetical protein
MENRQTLGLKGPVWKATEEWHSSFGESWQEWVFDREGMPHSFRYRSPGSGEYIENIEGNDRRTRVLTNSDGTRTEVVRIPGVAAWAPPGVHRIHFRRTTPPRPKQLLAFTEYSSEPFFEMSTMNHRR